MRSFGLLQCQVEDSTFRVTVKNFDYALQITLEDMRTENPMRFTIFWYCEAMMRHERRQGNFHMIEHFFA